MDGQWMRIWVSRWKESGAEWEGRSGGLDGMEGVGG